VEESLIAKPLNESLLRKRNGQKDKQRNRALKSSDAIKEKRKKKKHQKP